MTNPPPCARLFVGILVFALAGTLVPLHARAGGTIDAMGAEIGMRPSGTTTVVPVANRAGVPAGVSAVTLNVTATQSSGAGFATVFPCGTARPETSNINYGPGTTIANSVTSKVGADGTVCVYNESPTHLLVDVSGYFAGSSGFGALQPARLLDTRGSSMPASAEDAMLILIDQLRASRGLAAVTPDATLTAFARNWSATMTQSGFRHSGGPYSENIGWSSGSMAPEAVARRLFDAFVVSPPHLANMLGSSWTSVGVGVHTDGNNSYVTLEFR